MPGDVILEPRTDPGGRACFSGMSVDGRFVQTPNERRIIELLKKRVGRKASAAELGRHVGFPTKKGVNPLLYDMQRRGVIRRIQESPPVWQLIVTATNSGPGGYLRAGGSGGRKPLSPPSLLHQSGPPPPPTAHSLMDPPTGEHHLPWKRPRFDVTSAGGGCGSGIPPSGGIPSLLDMEPGQIAPSFGYNVSKNGKKPPDTSVRTILTNLNAQRRGSGSTAHAHAPAGNGSEFKPPPSPMEMLHGGGTTLTNNPFTHPVATSTPTPLTTPGGIFNLQSSHVTKRAPSGGGASGGSGIASWLSTPTRPSWMKSNPAAALAAGVTGTGQIIPSSSRPAAPNVVAPLLPTTSQAVQNNSASTPSQQRQAPKKIQSVNSLLKAINASRKGAYSPTPPNASGMASGGAPGSEKFVPPPSPAELISQAGANQLSVPPNANNASVSGAGRISPNNMMAKPPVTAGTSQASRHSCLLLTAQYIHMCTQ